jgi:hypothetical protein
MDGALEISSGFLLSIINGVWLLLNLSAMLNLVVYGATWVHFDRHL